MFRKIPAAIVALPLLTIHTPTARAADLIEPVAVTGYNWSGFYVGAGGGGGAVVRELSIPGLFTLDGTGGEGWFGEVTTGYDHMLTDRILVGVFADYRFGGIETDFQIAGLGFGFTNSLEQGWDVGGRIGFLLTPETLAYGLLAWSHQDFEISTPFGGLEWDADGYAVGGGLETVLGGNWTLKGEYRYTQYDPLDLFGLGLINLEPATHTFHASLNYRFGGASGEPYGFVPAEYDFTGLKAGLAGGFGAVVHEFTIPPLTLTYDGFGGDGAFAEVSLSYDYDLGNNWVVGVGGDYRWGNFETNLSLLGLNIALTADRGYDLFGRLGYKPATGTLVYGLAGYASQHFELTSNVGLGDDYDVHGWTAGAGIETALSDRWTAKIEYRYSEYDGYDFGTGGVIDLAPSTHTVRAGLTYKLF